MRAVLLLLLLAGCTTTATPRPPAALDAYLSGLPPPVVVTGTGHDASTDGWKYDCLLKVRDGDGRLHTLRDNALCDLVRGDTLAPRL